MATRIKICGLTQPGDAVLAAELGAFAVGMVFAPQSKRFVTAAQAQAICAATPSQAMRVGVFANQSSEVIRRVLEVVPLDLIQLHGRETNERVRDVGAHKCIKAVVLFGLEMVEVALEYEAAYLLPDRPKADDELWDMALHWRHAAELARRHPRVLLAGGLTPANVGDAIRVVRPWGVDVASGIEMSPGKKDPALLRQFFDAVARADDHLLAGHAAHHP